MTTDAPIAAQRPGVIGWFTAYCAFMALLYLVCLAGGAFLVVAPERLADDRTDASVIMVQGWVLIGIGAPLAIAYGVAPFLSRRPWVWIYDLVLICIGLTSLCCMPVTIPLLIFWIKPDAKLWFGRAS